MNDPFDYQGDERIQSSKAGYTKIKDGETVKLRVTKNMYAYYTFTPDGERMPLKNSEVKELLANRDIDDLFEDQTIKINERYAAIVWNYETDQAEVWQFSRQVFNQLAQLNRDPDWNGIDQHDMKVSRTGSGTDTTYTMQFVPKSQELTQEQGLAILNVDVSAMVAGAKAL